MENVKTLELQSRLPLLYFTVIISILHVCNVMAFKIVTIFGHQLAFTGIFFTASFLILTALNETYGHVETERHILYLLIGQTILILSIAVIVRIDTNLIMTSRLYYDLYKNIWRLLISSNLAVGLSYYFTSLLNSKLKCCFLWKAALMRFLLANGIGSAILVFATYPINFYGLLTLTQILYVCINTWIFKMLSVSILLLAAKPLANINKKIDKIDIYDFDVLYSPTKMYTQGNYGRNSFGIETYVK